MAQQIDIVDYFGGIKIDDLSNKPRDKRLSDMMRNEYDNISPLKDTIDLSKEPS